MSGMPAWEKYIGLPLLMLHDKIYKGTNGRIGHRILPVGRVPRYGRRDSERYRYRE